MNRSVKDHTRIISNQLISEMSQVIGVWCPQGTEVCKGLLDRVYPLELRVMSDSRVYHCEGPPLSAIALAVYLTATMCTCMAIWP